MIKNGASFIDCAHPKHMSGGKTPQRINTMQIKTSPSNRKCKYPDCESILSIYNHAAYCYVHLGPSFWEDNEKGVPIKKSKPDAPKIKPRRRSR